MDWRSLALREGMALPCDDMDLWKLAPINDISTFGILLLLRSSAACTSCNGHAHAACCSSSVSPPRMVLRSSDATCQETKFAILMAFVHPEHRALSVLVCQRTLALWLRKNDETKRPGRVTSTQAAQ